jgi:4-hydroxybenzoate polyprenyltransferase
MLKEVFFAMRPYQWIKNLFVFVPLLFGHKLFELSAFLKTTGVFILFCSIASAVYLINDIVDLVNDKEHPDKRLRQLASGKITALQAKITATIFGVSALVGSFILDVRVAGVLIAYVGLNGLYMKVFKKEVILDAFCIGGFFYLRVLAGSYASNVILSHWLILCTVLLALFLAFNKRHYDVRLREKGSLVKNNYSIYLLDRMVSILAASIVIAYALYAIDAKTTAKFGTDHLLYTIPFVYYGVFRYLYLIDKNKIGGDPTQILLRDYKMQVNLLLWACACIGIIYLK